MTSATEEPETGRDLRIPVIVTVVVALIIVIGTALMWRAEARTNKVRLSDAPKPVSVVPAEPTTYQPARVYVGTLRPWIEARIGPQFISAYVNTVLVRPGAAVKQGQVLATLDCRNASAETEAIASQAKAVAARQKAVADEAARTNSLLDGGFVSPNEAEQKTAQSAAEAAELAAQQASLAKSTLDVNDCVLRAPFDGEVSRRLIDPGAFARPGSEMLMVVDRTTVRMTADAPESDFALVRPGVRVRVHVVATNGDVDATITRRAPAADPGTRTVHFEVDLSDPDKKIPVDTTGEVTVPAGEPRPATRAPIAAASINDVKATLFTVEGGRAHAVTLNEMGEQGPFVYFEPDKLAQGTPVVTEGRALLRDGDAVAAMEAAMPTSHTAAVQVSSSTKASTP